MMKGSITILLIIASVLVVLGLAVFGVSFAKSGFDFKGLSFQKYVTNTYDIQEDFEKISIKTIFSDIVLLPSETEDCKVVFHENEKVLHSAKVREGELIIESKDEREWYDHISFFNFENETIKLYLPKKIYESVNIETRTGGIKIPRDFTFDSINITGSTGEVECMSSSTAMTEIKLTTGDIEIDNASFGDLRLTVSTGDIEAESIECSGDVYIKVSTGEAELNGINCKRFISEGTTGDIELAGVVASEKFDIKRSTGDVRFKNCDASEIYVKVGTGDVTGSLLSEKIFITESSTGSIRVPNSVSGGRCEIKTSTGDIMIQISDK